MPPSKLTVFKKLKAVDEAAESGNVRVTAEKRKGCPSAISNDVIDDPHYLIKMGEPFSWTNCSHNFSTHVKKGRQFL